MRGTFVDTSAQHYETDMEGHKLEIRRLSPYWLIRTQDTKILLTEEEMDGLLLGLKALKLVAL